MSDRRYIINKKCLAATRAMGEGKWAYAHVSKSGLICTDGEHMIARVSLPKLLTSAPDEPRVFTRKELADAAKKLKTADCINTMSEGREAKTGPTFTVPTLERAIPDATSASIKIDVNAKQLIALLQAASQVTEHAANLVRLRICANSIRIDAHRAEGEQEFTGVLTGIKYAGNCIPGEPTANSGQIQESFESAKLVLPNATGRKFR